MQWYSADCQAIHGTKAPQLWTMLTSAVDLGQHIILLPKVFRRPGTSSLQHSTAVSWRKQAQQEDRSSVDPPRGHRCSVCSPCCPALAEAAAGWQHLSEGCIPLRLKSTWKCDCSGHSRHRPRGSHTDCTSALAAHACCSGHGQCCCQQLHPHRHTSACPPAMPLPA